MTKNRVPDWLNSSLWYSSKDERVIDDASEPSTTINTAADAAFEPPEVVTEAPVPVPPPSLTITSTSTGTESPKPEIKHSRRIGVEIDEEESGTTSVSSSPEEISRQAQLLTELSKKVINIRDLRKIASQGIPDGAGIRSTVWKLLLGYLPPDRELWSSELAKKRYQYKNFKEEFLMNPSEITSRTDKSLSGENEEGEGESKGLLSRSKITQEEHPLSLGKTSIWNKFFQDSEIIEQIDRDVKRTHPDMHFFSADSEFAKSNQEALKNILIVFAKLNPGLS